MCDGSKSHHKVTIVQTTDIFKISKKGQKISYFVYDSMV